MARGRAELLIGAAAALASAAIAASLGNEVPTVAAAAVLGGALGAGRRYPREAWLASVAALLAMAISPNQHISPLLFFLVPAVSFCVGRWDRRWSSVAGAVALIGSYELVVGLSHEKFVPPLLVSAAAWAAARSLAEREQIASQLAKRVRELEQEREAHARLSVRYERARIASELHDIVAHALSVMVVQAAAGQRLAARDPGATAATFDVIADAARQAEQDLGQLVTLLGDERAIAPAPDLALVEELIERAVGSGLDVTLRLEGDREGLPASVVETAYRVVQEGLTNALRYAAGAEIRVLVRGDPNALLVQVENAAASRDVALTGVGSGTGLQGLRERVGSRGGVLEARPTPNGGWRLSAQLPRRVTADAS